MDGDGNPNVHGSRDTATRYRFDGTDTTDPAAGTFGMNLNPLAVEAVDLITAGATAVHGRAMGGFAGITTRSGGEVFSGRIAIYWRGTFLDGDGAGNDDVLAFDEGPPEFRDLRVAAAVGGPIVSDRFRYFVSAEVINAERNAGIPLDDTRVTTQGTNYLAKLTWQVDPDHRLDLLGAGDPLDTEGLGLGVFTSPDSGYSLEHSGRLTHLRWTATLSPPITLEAALARYESEFSLTPESPWFTPMDTTIVALKKGVPILSTVYPCQTVNCSESLGERRVYQVDGFTGRVSGPFPVRESDRRTRDSLRADVTWHVSGRVGEHRLRGGFELNEEGYEEDLFINPVLLDLTQRFISFPPPPPTAISGVQYVTVSVPAGIDRKVSNLATGLYVTDSWKPLPNLAFNFGARWDSEEMDAPGRRPFNPGEERLRSIDLWRQVCAEAALQGIVPASSNCRVTVPFDGDPPTGIANNALRTFRDADMDGINDVPEDVAALDLDGNGRWSTVGTEGEQIFKHLSRYHELASRPFIIDTDHVSPRVGVSWDPWSDGRTRFFAHWGRYYDRLGAEALLVDSTPDSLVFSFVPNATTHLIPPGTTSTTAALPSISQTDHDLRTPRTDELSLGAERQVQDAWSAGLTYIRRRADDLLQDSDINHYTCPQAGEVIGIDPYVICGDAGMLDTDIFGGPSSGSLPIPNGIVDLYAVNRFFNQILFVENSNRSDYTAWEVTLRRALVRNWEMDASYTWSKAEGEAATFLALSGDDPAITRSALLALDFDQRHVVKFQAASHLPHRVTLGTRWAWSSGPPFSVMESAVDLDSEKNTVRRILYDTGEPNDQRNEATLQIDARLEKGFRCGRVDASGFLIVQNLLDSDDLRIESISSGGGTLVATRDFGRRFEIGAIFGF